MILFSLLCFFLIFFSNNILKIIMYFLGSLILLSTIIDSWYNYFIILTYLGGLFILIVYMATLRFNREHFSLWGGSLLFLLTMGLRRLLFDRNSFILFVGKGFFRFLCVVLVLLLAALFLISFMVPSGIRSRGNV